MTSRRSCIRARISGAPVVTADGTLVGVVSEADILVKEQGREAISHRRLAGVRGESAATKAALLKLAAADAGEAMTTPAITIEGRAATIAEAARLMTRHRINRLPVVDNGELVGIVTRADLVRTFVKTDAELVAIIRDEVLWRSMWVDPAGFDVRCDGGHVRNSRSRRPTVDGDLIASVTAMVPGVIDVRSDIAFELDDHALRASDTDLLSPYVIH